MEARSPDGYYSISDLKKIIADMESVTQESYNHIKSKQIANIEALQEKRKQKRIRNKITDKTRLTAMELKNDALKQENERLRNKLEAISRVVGC